MSTLERAGLSLLQKFDPELAHGLSIQALRSGLMPLPGTYSTDRLRTSIAGMTFPNPVGLAAGYDKNAMVVRQLARAGFGFLEVGAATPKPQPGNPKPRLFRLTEDQAAINRFGFNNDGMDAIARRLSSHRARVPVGLNLGANKDSDDRAGDYCKVLERTARHIDFATVNVSSPNTANLRDLQHAEALAALLARVIETRDAQKTRVPVFLKIAPDLDGSQIEEVADVAVTAKIDGLIATNTTLDRSGLKSAHCDEGGGLSGQPLFEMSTRVLARLSKATNGALPIIGVGGVGSAEQAYQKILAGASAVQLYTALVYGGLSLIPQIASGLDRLLEENGFASVADAVGSGRDSWL